MTENEKIIKGIMFSRGLMSYSPFTDRDQKWWEEKLKELLQSKDKAHKETLAKLTKQRNI